MAAMVVSQTIPSSGVDRAWLPISPCLSSPLPGARRRGTISISNVTVHASCRSSESLPRHASSYECDFYDILGLERSASQQDIRSSYRWLQKRCHPDVAGPIGHDMSILLNQAYRTLADPHKRAAYDQTLIDFSEFEGYTGYPLYSKWFGSDHEEKAAFVDESRCIGCLKCALISPNTFAIENKFGRARVVGQWADPAHVIEDAMKSCPVDCISWVDRAQLAAFEYVMSKEPRVPVGLDVHSNGGAKTTNVFNAVENLLRKMKQRDEANASKFSETPAQREARLAAMEGLQTRAGRWWYHLMGNAGSNKQASAGLGRESQGAIVPSIYSRARRAGGNPYAQNYAFKGEFHRLFEAASQRHRERTLGDSRSAADDDEYWVPISQMGCSMLSGDENQGSTRGHYFKPKKVKHTIKASNTPARRFTKQEQSISVVIPIIISGIASCYIRMRAGSETSFLSDAGGLRPIPLEWINSPDMQILLAAAVWYMIGAAVAQCFIYTRKLLHGGEEKKDSP